MPHYGMDVLKAATIFCAHIKYAQDEGDTTYTRLMGFSNKLSDPHPVVNPSENIDTALIATLEQEVNDMEEQERFPITRPESKAAVRNLYNDVKQFHFDLVKKADINLLISEFQKVRNGWDAYRRSYLSEQFLNELELAKGEALPENKAEFDKRLMFWRAFIKETEDTISNIEKLLKDQLAGNQETPLEPTPV
jgi:hypothetical protein